MQKNKQAFTLVELIIGLSILTILSTISFIAFSGNIAASRDTKRLSDIATIESSLKLYKQKRGAYPLPGNSFILLNSGATVATQGKLDQNVRLSTLEEIPKDPKIDVNYLYSITKNKQAFEIAGTLENDEIPQAFLSGDYSSLSKNILPTITLAAANTDREITFPTNQQLFIFNKSFDNLPYNFSGSGEPYSKGSSFSSLLSEAEANDYWQNSDYTSCIEIYNAGKSIGDGEYQYLTGGILDNITCTMSSY